MDRREIHHLAQDLKNYLHYLAFLGLEALPEVDPPPEVARSAPETLDRIKSDLGDCLRCPLAQGRTNLVFGEGPDRADLMFVGEGPGEEEDRSGRPFVGAAGRLLTDIIVKGLKMRREDCYIANVVKCRPPSNRAPSPEEAQTCLPFLWRQIAVVRPKIIVALGRTAAQNLLETDEPLTRLRHRFHELEGLAIMPTFHPAALLYDPGKKAPVWEDIKLVIARLNR
ncbi:MAG: uracil-DNA glycosylase [Thermodesulfobacteriota bacterium]